MSGNSNDLKMDKDSLPKFKPLISEPSSTIKERKVNIKGVNDFDIDVGEAKGKSTRKKNSNNNVPRQEMLTKTAKISPATILRLNLLQSFISQIENGKRVTINDTIKTLANAYVENALTDRQKEIFNQLFEMQYKDL